MSGYLELPAHAFLANKNTELESQIEKLAAELMAARLSCKPHDWKPFENIRLQEIKDSGTYTVQLKNGATLKFYIKCAKCGLKSGQFFANDMCPRCLSRIKELKRDKHTRASDASDAFCKAQVYGQCVSCNLIVVWTELTQ